MRGRSLGPFDPARLRQLAKQGQLSRVHMLSSDGEHWQRASDFPELFQGDTGHASAAASSGGGHIQTAEQSPSQESADDSSQSKNAKSDAPPAIWFYGMGEQSNGPVTMGTLCQLITSGKLSPTDVVWKDGMQDWLPLTSVPELNGLLNSAQNDTSDQAFNQSVGEDDAQTTRSVIKVGNPWVFFCCIVMYVFSAFLFVSFFVGLVVGARDRNPALIQSSIGVLVQACILLTGALFLNRYSSYMNRFLNHKRTSDLNEGLRWLSRLWILVGIVTIVYLALLLIIVTVVVTTEITVFGY